MPPISGSPTTAASGVMMPSEMYVDGQPEDTGVRTHVDDTVPQQGAPEPGSGTVVVEKQVPFKDQVFGYTKTIRGTVFRKPETKEIGDKILNGEMSARDYLDQKKAAKDGASS